jgi:hypothetical protein
MRFHSFDAKFPPSHNSSSRLSSSLRAIRRRSMALRHSFQNAVGTNYPECMDFDIAWQISLPDVKADCHRCAFIP